MISRNRLEDQLKKINCHYKGWGRSEFGELCNILMPDEEIEECVNGYYEAGFALLVGTKSRLLLIDKKPLGYLTVEDLRFDMINEMDLHHRMIGAQIRVSAGSKTLHFTSLNQARLRRLLHYIQSRMTQIKNEQAEHQKTQEHHFEEMNEQLRLYLMAAHKEQYMGQAQAIQAGHMYGQPTMPSQQYQYPAAFGIAAAPPVQQDAPQPATPFEQAASAAFDQSAQAPMAAVDLQPIPATAAAASEPLDAAPTSQQIGLAGARRVVPIISAYGRLPLMNRRRHAADDGRRSNSA